MLYVHARQCGCLYIPNCCDIANLVIFSLNGKITCGCVLRGCGFIFLEKKGENVVDKKKMRNFTAEKDPQGFFLNTISYYLLFIYLFL